MKKKKQQKGLVGIWEPESPSLQKKLRVAGGGWRVAGGEWRVAGGEWRVASGTVPFGLPKCHQNHQKSPPKGAFVFFTILGLENALKKSLKQIQWRSRSKKRKFKQRSRCERCWASCIVRCEGFARHGLLGVVYGSFGDQKAFLVKNKFIFIIFGVILSRVDKKMGYVLRGLATNYTPAAQKNLFLQGRFLKSHFFHD